MASSGSRPGFARVALDGDFTVQTVPGFVESDELLRPSGGSSAVEADVFKAAMRVLAAGVVMVTTRFEGRAWGLTISSCCSLSLDPPQILVSLRESTISCREILRSGTFGVSILGREHRRLAEYGSAAGAPKFLDGFCERDREDQIGSPVVAGAIFHLDCSVTATYDVSDHVLLVGCVRRARAEEDAAAREPLLYYNRRFWGLGEQLE